MKTRIMQIGIAIIAMLASGIGIASANRDSAPTTFAFAGIIPNVDTATDACWQVESSPDVYGRLTGVAAVAVNDVWAVGHIAGAQPFIEHWDGTGWSIVPSPYPSTNSQLKGVAAVSTDDVWAVGYYELGKPDHTLIEHWDGTGWSIVPSPDSFWSSGLSGVAAIGANDVWAVGSYYDDVTATSHTLIEHWNGSLWSVVPSPDAGAAFNILQGVAAKSTNDVWAVGSSKGDMSTPYKTLVEHWDGIAWSIIPSSSPGTWDNILYDVSAVSANDVWAVGTYSDETSHTLIEHWNGTSWTVVQSPGPELRRPMLDGVAAIGANDVWAVGSYYDDIAATSHTLIEHWNGSLWSVVPSPNRGQGENSLNAVTAAGSDQAWGVGYYNLSFTLVEHYSLCTGGSPTPVIHTPTPLPTATPEPPRCPGERFTDVCPSDYFYQHVLDLNDLGVLSGYNTVPPCAGPAHIPCFKPYNWTSRGQIAKIVSLAAGFNEPVSSQTFEDVPTTHTFYQYIERIAAHHVAGGYPCGSVVEPCGPGNRPYFRPANTVSRGQLSKMVALAFDFNEPVNSQTFEDVPPTHTFYQYIERLAVRAIIQGYPCGDPGEPCNPGNRQYFRPGNPISRGQITKIVNLARTQPTPTPTPTVTLTSTPTDTPNPPPSETPTATATATALQRE